MGMLKKAIVSSQPSEGTPSTLGESFVRKLSNTFEINIMNSPVLKYPVASVCRVSSIRGTFQVWQEKKWLVQRIFLR